jgi:hypothetical protein
VLDLEPVETAQPVDFEVELVGQVAQLVLVAQEVRLEQLAVQVTVVEVVDFGEPRVGFQEESEQQAGRVQSSGQYYKLFTAVITPLAAYFSKFLTELCR